MPPIDTRLRSLLLPVLADKRLDNDALWCSEVLPLLQEYLVSLGHLVRQSVTANANAPATKIVDEIHQTLDEISRNLSRSFASAAPFTVHRVAELLLAYDESGYSLTTVVLAQKWLLALARTLSVSSSELSYNLRRSVAAPPMYTSAAADEKHPAILEEDCRRHNLPPNIRFVPLPWEPKSPSEPEVEKEATPTDEPALKRQKPSTEEEETPGLSLDITTNVPHTDESTKINGKDKSDGIAKPTEISLNSQDVPEEDLESEKGNKINPESSKSPQDTHINTEDSAHLRNDTHVPEAQILESRKVDNQDSGRPNSCKNGSIDFEEQKRHKEEVLI